MGAEILERARFAAVLFVAALLSGCVGGSIARQVASSIAMRVADKALDKALEEPKVEEKGQTNRLLVRSGLDPYQEAFVRAQLITPPARPEQPALPPPPDPAESAVPTVTRLATVEVWSLVVGEEKRSMLESMRELGIATLPPEHTWEQWQLAEGGMAELSDRPLLILVPPELGKMRSGDHAVIEVGLTNGFYVAKDRLE